MLKVVRSKLKYCEKEPASQPTVITARRVPPTPCPVRHLTAVSDSQSVPSHPVCPRRPLAVCRTTPMSAPCTVIDLDPVPARFDLRVVLAMGISSDTAIVKLPPLCPTVITDRRLRPAPCPVRHTTDVSDSQSVPSHPVCPSRPRVVDAASPSPAPCNRTAVMPDPPWLPRPATLTPPTSNDHAADALPPRIPLVITAR